MTSFSRLIQDLGIDNIDDFVIPLLNDPGTITSEGVFKSKIKNIQDLIQKKLDTIK